MTTIPTPQAHLPLMNESLTRYVQRLEEMACEREQLEVARRHLEQRIADADACAAQLERLRDFITGEQDPPAVPPEPVTTTTTESWLPGAVQNWTTQVEMVGTADVPDSPPAQESSSPAQVVSAEMSTPTASLEPDADNDQLPDRGREFNDWVGNGMLRDRAYRHGEIVKETNMPTGSIHRHLVRLLSAGTVVKLEGPGGLPQYVHTDFMGVAGPRIVGLINERDPEGVNLAAILEGLPELNLHLGTALAVSKVLAEQGLIYLFQEVDDPDEEWVSTNAPTETVHYLVTPPVQQ